MSREESNHLHCYQKLHLLGLLQLLPQLGMPIFHELLLLQEWCAGGLGLPLCAERCLEDAKL